MMQLPPRASLDELEPAARLEMASTTILGATIRRHRRTPIEQLGTEALRFLIEECQSVGLVLRIALDRLERDPFQSGDFHRGDLLVAVLQLPPAAWATAPELRARALGLVPEIERQLPLLEVADRLIVTRALQGFRSLHSEPR